MATLKFILKMVCSRVKVLHHYWLYTLAHMFSDGESGPKGKPGKDGKDGERGKKGKKGKSGEKGDKGSVMCDVCIFSR